MDVLVIDLTHGGVKIAAELKKMNNFKNIFAYDIYGTITKEDKSLLYSYDINVLNNEEDIISYMNKIKSKDLLVINSVHCPFNIASFLKEYKVKQCKNELFIDNSFFNNKTTDKLSIKEITHHEAVKLILNTWKDYLKEQKIPVVEVTGVKGKTSVVAMLKEILTIKNPLILSSLGSCLYKNNKSNNKSFILKKNISITPASVLEAVNLAKKIDNPDCVKVEDMLPNENLSKEYFLKKGIGFGISYKSCIFENSLGVTGLGDVAVLTNIVENYPIAKNSSNASNAKKQVFNCDIVVIEKETLDKYYSDYKKMSNINTFSFNDKSADIIVKNVNYNLNKSKIDVEYKNIRTISGNYGISKDYGISEGSEISESLTIETFAPGKHHVMNVVCVLATSLSLGIDKNLIVSGLKNFKGICGRTSLKFEKKSIVIEEINPGINTKAIESSIEMIDNLKDYVVILGGKYGVTCEEIDEDRVASLLDNYLNKNNNLDIQFNLVLTDDLGYEIEKKMDNSVEYLKDPIEAKKIAIDNNKNVLFIYRSNYSQINKR